MATTRHQLPELHDFELAAASTAGAAAAAAPAAAAGDGASAACAGGGSATAAAAFGAAAPIVAAPSQNPAPATPRPQPEHVPLQQQDEALLQRLRHDAALLLDADLSALGGSPQAYAAYAADIRAEYQPHYGAAAYAAGRCRVLRGFLQRPELYFTSRGRSQHEAAARANLAAELAELEAVAREVQAEEGGAEAAVVEAEAIASSGGDNGRDE
ncbi:hypothetical protein CHLRE_13g587650v5 [Chlamydomonas reinhardtii]|uniref:Uncharacterized protein n=1 Tax=Chlamydomonas reinhardtii TaxID=3055 RepID=A0A2K3D0Y3_CHLRE|nr:uncharacterized protein CHLRE_13g587650v5 [Chlamydomonas reinhardtii]PNW74159.1 hypothetical protein CHLRE_13g587650v5 [Chlamydomonas reinhardtii]